MTPTRRLHAFLATEPPPAPATASLILDDEMRPCSFWVEEGVPRCRQCKPLACDHFYPCLWR